VSHTYAGKAIQFPDGRCAEFRFSVVGQSGKHPFDAEVETWVADMRCALDWCAAHNFDVSNVGIMGHSLGGSTAMQICRRDNRIKAAINLDGPLYGVNPLEPVYQPIMFIVGSFVAPGLSIASSVSSSVREALMWAHHFNAVSLPVINTFISKQNSDVYKVTIDGIVHGTFSDQALTPDPSLLPWLIDGSVAHTIIHSYVSSFFGCYLQRQYAPLVHDLVSCWPNVIVEKGTLPAIF
jgi:pimeloyl-ACP methyl ester carboxylesterase